MNMHLEELATMRAEVMNAEPAHEGGLLRMRVRGLARGLHPTFHLLRTDPPLVTPALLVGALSFATVAATSPLVRVAYSARPELLPTVLAGLWTMAALSPLFALLKGAALGAVAWAVLVLGGAEARLRSVVSTLLYGQLFLVLQGTWMTVLLWLRGTDHLRAPADMLMPTGLDFLFPDPTTVMGAVARGVTPFHVAWVIFCAVVIARVGGASRWQSAFAAASVWMFVVGLGVVRAVVT